MSSCPREKIPKTEKIKSLTSSSVFLCINPESRKGSGRPGKEETVTESSLPFGLYRLGVRGVRRGESKTTRRLPRAGGQQPQARAPGQAGREEHLRRLGTLGRPQASRSPGAAADQLRSTRPTLPAPPGPPERGPRPRGAEGAGTAKRSAWGAPLPLRRPLSRGSALRDDPPTPGYSPVAEEGLRGMGPPSLSSHQKRPPARQRNSRDRPGSWKGALRPAAAAAAAREGCCFPHTGGSAEAAAAILNPSDSHIHTAPPG